MAEVKLIEDLIESVRGKESPVRDVRVGLSWACVYGENCGLAKIYESRNASGNYTRDMGALADKTTLELAQFAKSWNLVEAGIGVAAINSMISHGAAEEINAFDIILKKADGKKVTMVGAFPFAERVRMIAKELWVLELDPVLLDPGIGIIPAPAAEYVIPDSDIVVITGSAVVNKSIGRLLELASDAGAYTIVIGPSTPMSEVLFDYGADLLAGVNIVNPDAVMRKLSQSGGMLTPKNCPGELEFKTMEK